MWLDESIQVKADHTCTYTGIPWYYHDIVLSPIHTYIHTYVHIVHITLNAQTAQGPAMGIVCKAYASMVQSQVGWVAVLTQHEWATQWWVENKRWCDHIIIVVASGTGTKEGYFIYACTFVYTHCTCVGYLCMYVCTYKCTLYVCTPILG